MPNDEVLIIVEVLDVLDEARFDSYRAAARKQLQELAGTLVGRGGTLFEGAPPLGRSVLIQRWPSERAFRDWQASEAYAPLLKIRREVARLRITIVPAVN